MDVGDRIAYKAAFLHSICGRDMAQARGTITQLTILSKECILASIDWESGEWPARVNTKNICKVKSAAFGDRHAK